MQRAPRSYKLTSHRVGGILIILSFLWGLYLIKIQLDERNARPDYLKGRIIHLSKEYIHALAREKGIEAIDGQESSQDMGGLKKATAVLLTNMLDRIHILEKQVEGVIVNSTLEFENLASKIKSLNNSLRASNRTYYADSSNSCIIPDDPSYPECREKVMWLLHNWRTDPKYARHGVNGSICSALNYMAKVEAWCPRPSSKMNCEIPHDPSFPQCSSKVQWMRKFWISNPKFRSHGVDGSDCSILFYLSEVERFCPILEGRTLPATSDCVIPTDPAYPSCAAKVAWMRNFWKSHECYNKDYGVNGTICSFLVYLSEAENWCPLVQGRRKPTIPSQEPKPLLDMDRSKVEGLLNLLQDRNAIKFKWIKNRVQLMWPEWIKSLDALKKSRDFTEARQRKILVHMGVLANENTLHFAANADKGGPLGELVQWSDLIASLYLLGHKITVSVDIPRLQQILGGVKGGSKKPCPSAMKDDFDLIYLDYYGVKQMQTKVGQFMPHFKCKFRVLDSFGTEAQFNYGGFTDKVPGGSMGLWGRHNLNLKQYMTMFPHSPDNSFLGFVVGKEPPPDPHPKKRKARALVYGKHYYMWKDLKDRGFLDIINKYVEIHATVGGASEAEIKKHMPSYVINHGVLPAAEVQNLLKNSMLFVGLGFPYEGPAPLEAIANGCYFINIKYDPPRNRINTPFFKDKPTLRKITSQHPYAEEYIGKPYVYTVAISDHAKVDAVMKEIMVADPIAAYLPYEYTHKGMLERLHLFIQNQDFCRQNLWPPLRELKAVQGKMGASCKETCHEIGLVCEPQYFTSINNVEQLTRHGFPCNTTRMENTPSLVAPGYRSDPPVCLRQAQALLYSCTAYSPSTGRLCPCRKFKKGQVALCETC